ncbi:acyltransferase family protein [Acinetobacter baumannii]
MNIFNSYQKIEKPVSIQLDSLRGFSALLVLAAHLIQVFINPVNIALETFSQIFSQLAVMMFFVLSGFLICKSITRNSVQNNTFNAKEYAIDRINRILPPFIFSILLVSILFFIAPYFFESSLNSFLSASDHLARDGFFLDTVSLLGTMFFLNGFITETISANGPLWSLSYEVWYYILAAMTVLSNTKKTALMTTVLFLLLSALDIKFALHAVIWFSGFVLCIIHNNNVNFKTKKLGFTLLFSTMISLSFACFYVLKKHSLINIPLSAGFHLMLFKIFFGFAFSSYLYLILNAKVKFSNIFNDSAKYSYTLYIVHYPILLFLFGCFEHEITANIFNATLFSILSFFGIVIISKLCAEYLENRKPIKFIKEKALY